MFIRVIRGISLILVALVAGNFLAIPFSFLLAPVLGIGGSFMGNTFEYYMFGFPLAGSFFLSFLFSMFTDKYKFWWISIALLPVLWFEIQLAPILIMFSAVLVGIGLWIGTMANKALQKLVPGFMAKIG